MALLTKSSGNSMRVVKLAGRQKSLWLDALFDLLRDASRMAGLRDGFDPSDLCSVGARSVVLCLRLRLPFDPERRLGAATQHVARRRGARLASPVAGSRMNRMLWRCARRCAANLFWEWSVDAWCLVDATGRPVRAYLLRPSEATAVAEVSVAAWAPPPLRRVLRVAVGAVLL